MAKICTVLATSHSPFLFEPLDWWNRTRAGRSYAPGATVDDDAENERKHRRVHEGLARLRDVFQASRPDVVLAFGDDQEEQFNLDNHPAFAVYVGGAFEGYKAVRYAGKLGSRPFKPRSPEHWAAIGARPDLAKTMLYGLMEAGFDPAFMLDLPNKEIGMGHAFMRPAGPLTNGRFDVPMVPVLVNCLYAPQPTAARCAALARAARRIVEEEWPKDLRVAVLGSGGLWHTPGAAESYLDEDFDRAILARLEAGDADAMAEYFDAWRPRAEHADLKCFQQFSGGTGMKSGVGGGSGETRNWIMAAAVADRPGRVIDYIPVHASPCGIGFAHWEMDA
ncbi:hypothetical protein [Piscinibacter koreensis]|uniref:Extradiol ring-cleavage dioxygenase class III enzyme subunit B domain-containing protein n=1 Tax=Piscinibacter koreensis TaxID=2742824 RepID=A0A7Y6NQX1_9BURK|nr:hypothetical protein [Schlegelella koreensis]